MLFTGKNNREYESPILIRRDELGMTMKELCEKAGISAGTIYDLAYGMSWPVYVRNYEIKPYVIKLCEILSMDVEDMFPMFFCKLRQTQDVNTELFMSQYSIEKAEDPQDIYFDIEVFKKTKSEIESLECGASEYSIKRSRKLFMGWYYEDKTLDDLVREFGVTKERIRQIIARFMRMLKHPLREVNKISKDYDGMTDIYYYQCVPISYDPRWCNLKTTEHNNQRWLIIGQAKKGGVYGHILKRICKNNELSGREVWVAQ